MASDATTDVEIGVWNNEGDAGAEAATLPSEDKALLSDAVPRDDMKTHMSNERTFFKWLWSGLRLGSIGTFVLGFFADKDDPWRLPLVGFCWVVGLAFMGYGLLQYSARRQSIIEGKTNRDLWQNPAGPLAITIAFTVVVLVVIATAAFRFSS